VRFASSRGTKSFIVKDWVNTVGSSDGITAVVVILANLPIDVAKLIPWRLDKSQLAILGSFALSLGHIPRR
jgi:hypothetical protein